MVNAAEAVLLGLIQGFTEWLPVSSSAHLALAQYFFGIRADVAFDIVLHLGTLAAVIAYYRKDIGRLIYGTLRLREAELRAVAFILLAAVPTAIIGFMFRGFFESMFFQPVYVCAALLATGVFLILAENYSTEAKVNEIKREAIGSQAFATRNLEAKIRAMEKKEVGSKEAFIIGIAQGIAVAPGISRSGATIGAGLMLGVRKEEVARFSFLAAIIPILGAGILEGRDALATNIDVLPVILGFAVSAAVGYASIGILLRFLKQNRLRWFGYYCIALFAFVSFGGGGAGLQAGGNIEATPGGLVDKGVSENCVLSVAQTLSVGSYDADKQGTAIATPSVQVFSDAATGKLNPGNTTTQPGYKYKAWAVKANYFGAADDITTGCVASPQLSLYQKEVDTAVSVSAYNADGVTANTNTANQTIGSSGVGTLHLKLQQSASYKHLSGANNKFSVFLNATNVTDWDTSQTVVSFDGKECTTYTGAQPTAITGGVMVKGWDCDGDFSAIDGNLHSLDVRLAAANGVNPTSQALTVNFVGQDLFQDTVTGVFKVGGVKNDGSAIQTMQSKAIYVG